MWIPWVSCSRLVSKAMKLCGQVSSTSTTTTTPVATTTVATTTTTVATTTATTTTTVATTTPASTTAATTPSTTVGTTTTTASTTSGVTTATTTASVECKKRYEKCGGMNYDGATCCEPGCWSVVSNIFRFDIVCGMMNQYLSPLGSLRLVVCVWWPLLLPVQDHHHHHALRVRLAPNCRKMPSF